MSMAAFIAVRLAEDESIARAAGGQAWRASGGPRVEGDDITIYDEGGHDGYQAEHIARHDPARVLRDVEAQRKIFNDCQLVLEHHDHGYWIADRVLRQLASIWSDHPDYQADWQPHEDA